MSRLYRCEEWQSASGRWYVEDVKNIGETNITWWTCADLLGQTHEEFVAFTQKEYKADVLSYEPEKDLYIFSFKTQAEARKYKNFINKKARERKFMV